MKKRIAMLICLCLLAAAGCRNKTPKVAFLLYDGTDTFIGEMMDKMAHSIPPGIEYEIFEADNSQSVQNQQIVERIANGADLLVINAVDRLACSTIVELCTHKDIPVIFFNREPLEDAMHGGEVYYVGAAADSLGRKQADMVAGLFGPSFAGSMYDKNGDGVVQLVILKGEQGHQDAEKRTENCVNHLRALGFQAETMAIEVANWTRQEGYDAMRRLFAEYGERIELVFSNNDDMALGAIDYLMEIGVFRPSSFGYVQPFVIVGVDGTAVGLEAVCRGLLYGTVNNDSTAQADAILTLMGFLLEGRDLADYPYEITRGHYIYIDGAIILRSDAAALAS